jgi:hypothetical protein
MFAWLALLLGVYGVFTCNAVQFDSDVGAISVGLYGYRTKSFTYTSGSDTIWVTDTCTSYDNLNSSLFTFTTDKWTDALQALAITIAVVGGLFSIIACCVPCLPELNPLAWKGLGLMFLFCCIFQGVSLMVLESSICLDNPLMQFFEQFQPAVLNVLEDPAKCTRAPGFNFGISATVFWFVAAIIALAIPAPVDDTLTKDVAGQAVAAEADVEDKREAVEEPAE